AINMVTCHYANQFGPKGWKVNASDPGFCATNFNGFRGWGTPESGALETTKLATLGKDGPNGTFTNTEGTVGW
ncbi:SDR family oxidoreductase, partial [Pseudomonas aeruginosa]